MKIVSNCSDSLRKTKRFQLQEMSKRDFSSAYSWIWSKCVSHFERLLCLPILVIEDFIIIMRVIEMQLIWVQSYNRTLALVNSCIESM